MTDLEGGGATPRPSAALKRSLRPLDVVVLTLSALSPAASVYITGSGVLHIAGTGAAAAVIAGAALAVLASILFAELGAAYPHAGGVYRGIDAVLGPGAGFVAIVLGLITGPAFLAFISLGLADYLRVLAPALPKLPIAYAVLCSAVLMAVLNIRTNAWITGAFLLAEMAAIVVLLVVAGAHPVRGLDVVLQHPTMLASAPGAAPALAPTPFWTVRLATISAALACSGSAWAIYFAEELGVAPRRIGGVVATTGLIAAGLVCVPLVLVTTGVRDLAGALASEAPIAFYLKEAAGPLVAGATALVVALAILNNVIASLLGFSRFLYATGRDRIWPAPVAHALASLHPRFGSPWIASATLGLTAALLCLLGERTLLIVISGDVFTATMVAAAVLIGRRRGLTGLAGAFRTPLFPAAPLLGLLSLLAFLAADWRDQASGRPSLCLLASVVVGAFAYHAFVLRPQAERRRARPVEPGAGV